MIVCLCKNVTEGQIKRLISEGKSLQDVIKTSEAGTACGACTPELRKCAEERSCQHLVQASRKANK